VSFIPTVIAESLTKRKGEKMPPDSRLPTGANSKAIAARLIALRRAHQFTGQYISERCGISPTTYSRYESGKLGISMNSAIGINCLYGVNLDFVVLGEDKHIPLEVAKRLGLC